MAVHKVRLLSCRIQGYRSCARTEFSVEKNVTALIGPNGSGKTNILHALRLLKRGRRRLMRREAERDQSALRSQIYAEFLLGGKKVGLKADVIFRPAEHNREHIIRATEKWDFTDYQLDTKWVAIAFAPSPRPTAEVVLDENGVRKFEHQLSIIKRVSENEARLIPVDKAIKDAVDAINSFRMGIDYYSASQFTNPTLCPTSFEIDEDGDLADPLLASRSEHIRFLHDLYKTSREDAAGYSNYLSVVGGSGIGLIDEIVWRPTTFSSNAYEVRSGGRVITKNRERTLIIPTVQVGGYQLSFDQLSEGTFRSLATLFHIMTDTSSLLLLEEPEVFVHHGLLNSIIEVIKNYSEEKQILLSTHSETVIDAFEPEQLRLVRKDSKTGTKVTALSKALSAKQFAALKKYLKDEGNLGEYWKHGGFDK